MSNNLRSKQTGAGSFERVMCNECGIIKMNPRCMEVVKSRGYKDGTKQTFGSPFCLICANARRCAEGMMRCTIVLICKFVCLFEGTEEASMKLGRCLLA